MPSMLLTREDVIAQIEAGALDRCAGATIRKMLAALSDPEHCTWPSDDEADADMLVAFAGPAQG